MTDHSAAEAELNPALLFLSAPIIHFRNNISSLKRLGVPQVTEDAQGSFFMETRCGKEMTDFAEVVR